MASINDKKLSRSVLVSASAEVVAEEDDFVPPEQIVDLPVEMQLRILSYLPAKEIQRFRRVKRHFRDMIDLKENHTLLSGRSITASLARLDAFIKRYCEFPMESENGGPDAYLDAIFDFIKLLRSHGKDLYLDVDLFHILWVDRSRHVGQSLLLDHDIVQLTDNFHQLRSDCLHNGALMPPGNIFGTIFGEKSQKSLARIEAFVRDMENSKWPATVAPVAGTPARIVNICPTPMNHPGDRMRYCTSVWAVGRLKEAMGRSVLSTLATISQHEVTLSGEQTNT